MSVLTITERVAQARPGEIPCRTNESDLWFSDTATDISKAQAMCRACPLVAECLAGAIERIYARLATRTGAAPRLLMTGGAAVKMAPIVTTLPVEVIDGLIFDGLLALHAAREVAAAG